VRRGDTHLAKENVRELVVIVLAGMDEDGLNLRMALHFPHERSYFRKIGTRPDDIKDFQALAHGFVESDGEKQYNSRVLTLVIGVADSQSSPKPQSFGVTASSCRSKHA
jgi:hypothetical protein